MKAAAHPQQAARIAALASYHILDTPRETEFDEIVALVSGLCGTPISVVNLIDEDRQWFKAEVGLGARETPLDTSICSHVILEEDFVEIGDMLQDCRMQDNELCTGTPGLRFYAGALLKTADGLPLGTLCVLDYEPRQLTDFQRNAIKVLARQVMTQLDLRLALRRQMVLQKEIDHRVKNSLQMVSALVRLQQAKVSDPGTHAILGAVDRRVGAIALIHEQLHQTSPFEEVEIGAYLHRLGSLLQQSAPAGVSIDFDVQPLKLASHRASSVGVVVSEFVMNAFKHAFPDGRLGGIKVEIRAPSGLVELCCADNGVGSAAAVHEDSSGLGLRIIEASAAQLGGSLEVRASAAGFKLKLTFPVQETQ